MPIKRINEFPEASGSLTGDDIFLFMDDPSNSGVTKKISLNEIASNITNGVAFLDSPNFTGVPTVPTAVSGTNTTQIASTAFVRNEVSSLVDSAPILLDTLNELAAAINDDANFASTIASGLASKAPLEHTHVSNDITNFNTSVSGLLPVKDIVGSTNITISNTSGQFTVSATGLQPSGNYSVVGHGHVVADVSGLQNALDNKQPIGVYASGVHSHTSSDITNFNTSVSGLLPVKDIVGSTNITISNTSGQFTVSATGLQPSGNYSVVGHGHVVADVSGLQNALDNKQPIGVYASGVHSHTSSDITDFNSTVSGLLPTIAENGSNRILSSDGTSTGIKANSNLSFNNSFNILEITSDNIGDGNILRMKSFGTEEITNRLDFRKYRGSENSRSSLKSGDNISIISNVAPNISGIDSTVARIITTATGEPSGINIHTPTSIRLITSSGPGQLDNRLELSSDGRVFVDGYINQANINANNYFGGNVGIGTMSPLYKLHVLGNTNIDGTFSISGVPINQIFNENYITALGTLTGSNAINYDPSNRSIQTLTLNGTAVTFTKGTGWPTASNVSVDTVLRITVTTATTITWSIVNDWFNQPQPGALSVGTHLFLLRAVGSSIIEGHYIGNKTN